MSFRIGILGAGNISETHARAAQATPSVRVVAVHGRNEARAASLAQRCGATAYADLDEFLDSGLDVVLIGSPSGQHADQARAAARRGIHALVEKPLDIHTDRIDQLIAEADAQRIKVGVFFQDRAAAQLQWLHALINEERLGRIILAAARVRWFRPPEYYASSKWRGTRALDGGGALMNQGIHTVDLLLWLLGDVSNVCARARTALHDIEVEDTIVACLEFENGAIGTLEATTAAYPGYPRRMEITGSEGTAVIEGDRVMEVSLRSGTLQPPVDAGLTNPSATSATVSDVRGHQAVLHDFLQAIQTGAPPLCDGQDGRRSVALVQAIYESAASATVPALST